jgi:hypothetical protein
MSVGGLAFDQSVPNELWTTDGVGVWNTTNLPTSGLHWYSTITWNDQSIGIEELVANEVIAPPGGNPIVASWDRAFFTITDPNSYPTSYGPINGTFVAGWSLDYASSNPSFIVGLADWWGTEESGYSTNGGQTWTQFPTFIPGAGSNFIGGTIAASTPQNIIWAPSSNQQPYYTLDGGQTWNPISLPGVSSWSGFDFAYYLNTRTVTADRVLPNTFYLYDSQYGLFETTNGGVTWTEQHAGQISTWSNFNAELQSVPGEAGNLFFTSGPQSNAATQPGFFRSVDQGATWTAVANVQQVNCFGFGAPAPGQSYPSIYIVGLVNNVYGIWQSNDNAQSWVQIGTQPNNSLAGISTISGDPNHYGQVYVGFNSGDGFAYLPAAATGTQVDGPSSTTITSTAGSPANSSGAGATSASPIDPTTTPSVSSNGAGNGATSGTPVNEPSSTTATSTAGTPADSSGAGTTSASQIDPTTTPSVSSNGAVAQSGPQIDTTAPTISSVVESPASGDLNVGKTVTLTLNLSEAVTVAGAPTLALNDGGTAIYSGGSGTSELTFSYTVGAGQRTSDLAVTAVNLTGGNIADAAGNAADLSLSGLTQSGPQIDTLTPHTRARANNAGQTSGTETVPTAPILGTIEVTSGAKFELFEPIPAAAMGAVQLDSGATLQVDGADPLNVVFATATGLLILEEPTQFAGIISASGGSLASGNVIDVRGFDASASITYSGTTSGGTVIITESGHTTVTLSVGENSTHWGVTGADNSGTGILIHDPPSPAPTTDPASNQIPNTNNTAAETVSGGTSAQSSPPALKNQLASTSANDSASGSNQLLDSHSTVDHGFVHTSASGGTSDGILDGGRANGDTNVAMVNDTSTGPQWQIDISKLRDMIGSLQSTHKGILSSDTHLSDSSAAGLLNSGPDAFSFSSNLTEEIKHPQNAADPAEVAQQLDAIYAQLRAEFQTGNADSNPVTTHDAATTSQVGEHLHWHDLHLA